MTTHLLLLTIENVDARQIKASRFMQPSQSVQMVAASRLCTSMASCVGTTTSNLIAQYDVRPDELYAFIKKRRGSDGHISSQQMCSILGGWRAKVFSILGDNHVLMFSGNIYNI